MAWNQSNASHRLPPQKRRNGKLGVLVLCAVGIGIVSAAVLLILNASSPSEPEQVETKPTKKPLVRVMTNGIARVEAAKEEPVDEERVKLREKLKRMTPEERSEFILKRMQERTIDLTPTTNRPFRTGIELSMARIFTTEVGDAPPPPYTTMVPIQDEVHLAEILMACNPQIEGDNEFTKDAKETVELAKKELIDWIKDGGDAESFLTYYYNKLQDAFEERRIAKKELARVCMEEPEIAQEYYEAINKRLSDKGIKTIDFNEKQKQKLGLE